MAHAHCQQALSDKYFQGFKNWRHKSTSEKLTIITLLFVLCPVWLIVYVTLPPTRLDYYLEYPLMKAVANFACYAAVLIMLVNVQVNIAKGFVLSQGWQVFIYLFTRHKFLIWDPRIRNFSCVRHSLDVLENQKQENPRKFKLNYKNGSVNKNFNDTILIKTTFFH